MSEVITPPNGDDVLTLIRRLVIEPPLVLEHPVDSNATPPDPAPLLVLTPALRVEEDELEATSDGGAGRSPQIEPLLLVEPILSDPSQDMSDAASAAILADLPESGNAEPMGAALLEKAAHLGVDPAELRDVLRDLIREELAGPLGARMTRNIRKLVRAEIARELAMRELD